MNVSNNAKQLSWEFYYAILMNTSIRMNGVLVETGYLFVTRREIADFESMQLMGGEIAR